MRALSNFWSEEGGAVTVDWVVLTAAMVALGAGVILMLTQSATNEADSLGAYISTLEVE